MPLRQRKKLKASGRPQAKDETSGRQSAQAPAAEGESQPSSSGVTTRRKVAAGSCDALKQQGAASTTASIDAPGTSSSKRAIKRKQSSSQAPVSTVRSPRDALTNIAGTLVQFIMHTSKKKKPIMKADMLKIIPKKYQKDFLEILKRATCNIEVVFGVDLKEVDSTEHSYTLVSKMNLPNNGVLNRSRGLPQTGLLMNILAVIFLKGNSASEETIWEFLNKMKVFAGKRHFLFGEPRKLITKDFVKLKYLEYRQVPNSDPACYEFLWGPRAYAETSKMKVLEFLAKIHNTVPSAFSTRYEEALRDERERAEASDT
ncbi:melanoma-associated antigen B3-like [Ochotona curzoniae]|uniref:melanoma-associated antigen B3-like n=1 Tax=Ochotona curzoniae TaxID=130825 RepID=UPI001B354133|nr:melanoma-associated antigen B3-like [Ochotona curzoniae]